MIRTLLWLLAGAVLGGIIHIVVILALPIFATQDVWTRITALGAVEKAMVLPAPALGEPNPLRLGNSYGVLISGPGNGLQAGVVSTHVLDAGSTGETDELIFAAPFIDDTIAPDLMVTTGRLKRIERRAIIDTIIPNGAYFSVTLVPEAPELFR